MITSFGNEAEFALLVDVHEVILPKRGIWGGFELVINGIRLGDIHYTELISGSIYTMIQRFYELVPPVYPFKECKSDTNILQEVYDGYAGEGNYTNHNYSLHESYEQSSFWAKFIVKINSIPFDQISMIYLQVDDGWKFIFKSGENAAVESLIINPSIVKAAASDFINWYSVIING